MDSNNSPPDLDERESLGSVAIGFIGCKMNKAVQIVANFRQIWPDILLKFATILPGYIYFSLRQTQWLQTLDLDAGCTHKEVKKRRLRE